MELFVKRITDDVVFKVHKFILGTGTDDTSEHIWCNDWHGHHVIGIDCIWETKKKEISITELTSEQLTRMYHWLLYKIGEVETDAEDVAIARMIEPFLSEEYGFTVDELEQRFKNQ